MTKVQVVNRQAIDGKEYKRGQVIDVSPGRARDLLNEGKVREPEKVQAPAPVSNKEAVKNG